MESNEQTQQQAERFIRKIIQKFPFSDEDAVFTDIHLCVSQESGEMLAFDDDDQEITRCVINQWIDNKEDEFYENITLFLRTILNKMSNQVDEMGLVKPFSFVLENDDKETIAELYLADDDTIIIGSDLMEDLDQDLDKFFEQLINS